MAKLEGKIQVNAEYCQSTNNTFHSFKTGGFKNNKILGGKIKCLKKVPY
jgi:hypothetical protein